MIPFKSAFRAARFLSLRLACILFAFAVCVSVLVVCRADLEGFIEDGLSSELCYYANGGIGSISPSVHTVGSAVTLNDGGTFNRSGYSFSAWNTAADGTGTEYSASQSIKMPHFDLSLYAVWVAVPPKPSTVKTLTYDGNGSTRGTAPPSEDHYPGETVTLSANIGSLFRGADYGFSGWGSLSDGTGARYPPGSTFTMGSADLTLYAVWTELEGLVGAGADVTVGAGITTGTDQNGNPNSSYYSIQSDSSVALNSADFQFDYNEAFSVSVWFNATSLSTAAGQYPVIFMQHGGGGSFQYLLVFIEGLLTAAIGKCGSGQNTVRVAVSENTWYHVVMAYDGTTLELYVDGVSRGTIAYSWGPCSPPTECVYLGGKDGGSSYFKGVVGDFRVFARTLAKDEVSLLYGD